VNAFTNAQNLNFQRDVSVNAVARDQNNVVYGGDHNVYNSGAAAKGIELLHRHCSSAALLDSKDRLDQPQCLEGTREVIIKEIMDWVKGDPKKSASMLWLKGPAGAGKTALEYTMAHLCKDQGLLIAAFIFSRTAAQSSDGKLLIPTLAFQLIQTFPEIESSIDKAIRKDPQLLDRASDTQMTKLIIEPLKRLSLVRRVQNQIGWKPYPRVTAIDGLDECSSQSAQSNIIQILGDAIRDLRIPVRFLVASRPEPHITEAIDNLRARYPHNPVPEIDLKTDALAQRDIDFYFRTKFKSVLKLHPELLADWPGEHIIMQLVDKASCQFVYAVTVMSYLISPYDRPEDRLEVVLLISAPPSDDKPFAPVDGLYLHILRTAKHRETILRILGVLISERATGNGDSGRSLGPADIEVVLDLKPGDVRRSLTDMHSLVDFREKEGYIKILHASLSDFLLDSSRSMELFIDIKTFIETLAMTFFSTLLVSTSFRSH